MVPLWPGEEVAKAVRSFMYSDEGGEGKRKAEDLGVNFSLVMFNTWFFVGADGFCGGGESLLD